MTVDLSELSKGDMIVIAHGREEIETCWDLQLSPDHDSDFHYKVNGLRYRRNGPPFREQHDCSIVSITKARVSR